MHRILVACRPYCSWSRDVQVRASQGRRGRDTGSYLDRGERREVRAWASRNTSNETQAIGATGYWVLPGNGQLSLRVTFFGGTSPGIYRSSMRVVVGGRVF